MAADSGAADKVSILLFLRMVMISQTHEESKLAELNCDSNQICAVESFCGSESEDKPRKKRQRFWGIEGTQPWFTPPEYQQRYTVARRLR